MKNKLQIVKLKTKMGKKVKQCVKKHFKTLYTKKQTKKIQVIIYEDQKASFKT